MKGFTAAAVLFGLIVPATVCIAQDDLEALFRNPPEPGIELLNDIDFGPPDAAGPLAFDPLDAVLSPETVTVYQVRPDTPPALLRSLILQNEVVGGPCQFGLKLSNGAGSISDQPYWPHSPGLGTVHARLEALRQAGECIVKVGVLLPWLVTEEATDAEKASLRGVISHLMSIQTGFALIMGPNLSDMVTDGGKLRLGERTLNALILPRVTIGSKPPVDAIRRLITGGTKVIAVHALPAGPEGGGNWVEETFGVKSIDEINDPILQKGNAVVVPAELNRLNPMLNGMQCEDLLLYPPSRKVLSAHYVSLEDDSVDWHLLYNTDDHACHTYLTLYRKCAPEIWDLDTGEVHIAPGARYTEKGTTLLPLVLEPEEAIALVCRPAPPEGEDHHIVQAPGLEKVEISERDGKMIVTGLARLNGTHTVMLADGRKGKGKVEGLPAELMIEGAWRFKTERAFDRQPSRISEARVRAAGEGDDTTGWSAGDLDDSVWDLVAMGDPLPSLAPKWHARWLTYNGDGEVRHFRRKFDLPAAVKEATVTVTADNAYELYVNGEKIGADGDWYTAETYDIAGKLKQGANAIAIRVDNEGSIAALLCEARAALKNGDLVRIATDETWRMVKGPGEGWEAIDFDDSGWGEPTVGGSPPTASPWNAVPGLPPEPNTGREIWYRFDLPPGAARLRLPDGAEPLRLYVAGDERSFDGLEADLGKAKGAAVRRAALVIAGPDPLAEPIKCDSDPSQTLAGDWATQGLVGYVGEATYERVIDLPQEYSGERLFLDLGDVGLCANVRINGKDVGTRISRPWVFDLGKQVKKGKNRLRITVANTLASASEDAPPAGILGPVRLLPRREVEVIPE